MALGKAQACVNRPSTFDRRYVGARTYNDEPESHRKYDLESVVPEIRARATYDVCDGGWPVRGLLSKLLSGLHVKEFPRNLGPLISLRLPPSRRLNGPD